MHLGISLRLQMAGKPWTPLALPGVVDYWQVDTLMGLNDGDPVANVAGSLGKWTLTQATPARRPLYKPNIRNGRPILRGDGTDDFVGVDSDPSFDFDATESFTVWMVGSFKASKVYVAKRANSTFVDGWDLSTTVSDGQARRIQTTGGNAQVSDVSGQVLVADSWNVVVGVFTGTNLECFVNGLSNGATAGTENSNNGTALTVGAFANAGASFSGDWGECGLCVGALSVANRQLLETYLKARWATP